MSSGAVVLVQAQLLNVDTTCSVLISSFGEEECRPASTNPTGSSPSAIDGTVVGAVVATLVVVLIAVGIAVLLVLLVIRTRSGKLKAKVTLDLQTSLHTE